MTKPIAKFCSDKFLAELVVTERGCHEHRKSNTQAGYGRVWIHPKLQFSHRIAWALANGPIPDGLCVLHKCDNPPCCNPDHLFLGTAKDNALDKSAKGRAKNGEIKGESHTLAKLTEIDVLSIKAEYRPGTPGKASSTSIKALSAKYGVASSLIHRIIKGQSWPHINNRQVIIAP